VAVVIVGASLVKIRASQVLHRQIVNCGLCSPGFGHTFSVVPHRALLFQLLFMVQRDLLFGFNSEKMDII